MAEFRHIVTTEDDQMEVREIMRKYFDFSSRLRNKIKRNKLVYRNGEQTEGWHRVDIGDEILIKLPDDVSHFPAEDIPIDVVYEDDDLMIVNKQPGITVHPTRGHPDGTIANGLMKYMQQSGQSFKIRFINRLDRDTSGLLIVAKNAFCQNEYTKQSKANEVRKQYVAIVKGIIAEDEGTIDLPIGRPDPVDICRCVMEDGYPSVTHYRVLERFEKTGYTMLQLLLETGRTHQIRVHLSHIGYPILSDHLYGTEEPELMPRQALHAARLSFTHPVTHKPLEFEAPLPEDMKKAADMLRL